MFPSNFISVFPQLDLSVVRARSNQILCWMETNPVTSPLVSVEHLHTLNLHADESAKIARLCQLLPEHREIPKPYRIVERCGNDQIFLWVELRAHDVVAMSRDDVHTGPALVIPDAHGLVVAGRQYPRQFVMEEGRPYVVYVPLQGKLTSLLLQVPHLHHAVVAPRNE